VFGLPIEGAGKTTTLRLLAGRAIAGRLRRRHPSPPTR
jgi:ABC-type uncharacterized transport system ATPase subunit